MPGFRTTFCTAAVLTAVTALVGCGGGEETASVGAASLAPASAPFYATVDADLSSDQWQQLDELLGRFPGRDRLIAELRSALADEGVTTDDIDRAFGPTVEVVILDFDAEQAVGLTQTDDKDALRELLASDDEDDFVIEELDEGWVAFSDEQSSIDALKAAEGKDTLADEDRFTDALGELPDEALAKLYVNGTAVQDKLESLGGGSGFPQGGGKLEAFSGALVAEDDGMRFQFFTKTDGSAEPPDLGELLEDVPDDVIAFLDLGLGGNEEQFREGVEDAPGAGPALRAFEDQLGVSLEDLTALLKDEFVVYVRPATLIPEVTLVAKADEERGRATIDKLLDTAVRLSGGETRQTTIGDLEATEAVLGPVSIYAAAYDGRVVVTTSKQGLEDLRGDGDKLEDDERYQDAREAADVGDDADVWFYVDIDEAYGLVERLAQLGDEPVPPDVKENVEPLRAVLFFGEIGKDESRGSLFVSVD